MLRANTIAKIPCYALAGAARLGALGFSGSLGNAADVARAVDAGHLALAAGAQGLGISVGAGVGAWHVDLAGAWEGTVSALLRAWGAQVPVLFVIPESVAQAQALSFVQSLDRWCLAQPPVVVAAPSLQAALWPQLERLQVPCLWAALGDGFHAINVPRAPGMGGQGQALLLEHLEAGKQESGWRTWLDDDLCRTDIAAHWAAGYNSLKPETFIEPSREGLRINMIEGTFYSSAALVTLDMLRGDFDAVVRFKVANPMAGTTLELAAIAVEPPRTRVIQRELLNGKDTSLVFDVHGTPPYVCSECDEADGYRIAWNRAYTTLEHVPTSVEPWRAQAQSTNHYNRYGKDAGGPTAPGTQAWLRLMRCGSHFASLYKADTPNAPWQLSGALEHAGVPAGVFLRLAAKHWVKGQASVAPKNQVTFSNLHIQVPTWKAA